LVRDRLGIEKGAGHGIAYHTRPGPRGQGRFKSKESQSFSRFNNMPAFGFWLKMRGASQN
jgi:hypothetical protein